MDNRKFVYFLPNIFTGLNLGSGYLAIMSTFQGEIRTACLYLILGAIFDSVDGRLARLTGTQSSFGEQFDSMSDLISFGMAPALMFYFRFLQGSGRVGPMLAFLFLLCGALRLARFNANIDRINSEYFQGMPIPLAALSLVGYTLISLEFQFITQYFLLNSAIVFFYSVLMISNFPFPSFKDSDYIKKHKKQILFYLFVLFASIYIYMELMVGTILFSYLIGAFLYYLWNRKKLKNIFDTQDFKEE